MRVTFALGVAWSYYRYVWTAHPDLPTAGTAYQRLLRPVYATIALALAPLALSLPLV